MYKKLFIAFSALFLALTTTGCVKYSTSITVTKSGKLDLSMLCTYDTDQVKAIMPDFKMDTTKAFTFEEQGYVVQDYKEGAFVGQRVSKSFNNTNSFTKSDLPDGYTLAEDVSKPIEVDKTLLKTYYYVHLNYDPEKLKGAQPKGQNPPPAAQKGAKKPQKVQPQKAVQPNKENPQTEVESEYQKTHILNLDGTNPQTELLIKIPGKSVKNNAKVVSLKTHEYLWVFESYKGGEILLQTKSWNVSGIIYTLLALIALIILIIRRIQFRIEDAKKANLTE